MTSQSNRVTWLVDSRDQELNVTQFVCNFRWNCEYLNFSGVRFPVYTEAAINVKPESILFVDVGEHGRQEGPGNNHVER